MSREWQPGDVAILPNGRRAVVSSNGNFIYDDVNEYQWAKPDSINGRAARPLVVIDPEDAKQVRVIRDLVCSLAGVDPSDIPGEWRVREALRKLADPKPPCGASLTLGKDAALYRCSEVSEHKGPHADGTCVWTAES